jgi:hypothetical protein
MSGVTAWGADGVGRLQVQHGKERCSTHRIWRIAEYVYGGCANDLRLTSMMSASFARAKSSHSLSKTFHLKRPFCDWRSKHKLSRSKRYSESQVNPSCALTTPLVRLTWVPARFAFKVVLLSPLTLNSCSSRKQSYNIWFYAIYRSSWSPVIFAHDQSVDLARARNLEP